jgi:hypothetical protein
MTVDLTIKNCKIWFNKQLVDYGLSIDEGVITSISKDSSLPNSDEMITLGNREQLIKKIGIQALWQHYPVV